MRRENNDTYQLTATSCQGFNDLVCGPFNREGLLCSKCKPGYGPAPYANSLKCEKCHDKYTGWLWLLYLLLELISLTIFYFLIVLFNIRATLPPFTSFVFFCQLFSELFKGSVHFQLSVDSYSNNIFSRIVFTLVNIWSLDFFRYAIPPFHPFVSVER